MTQPLLPWQAEAAEARRLETHASRILARLQQGEATNRELAAISLKYTGRISDLRKAGHVVNVVSRDLVTGLVTYALGARSWTGERE